MPKSNAFVQGYFAALADLARMSHIGETEIKDALDGVGLSLAQAKDEDDRRALRDVLGPDHA